jgi:hypothetical protein
MLVSTLSCVINYAPNIDDYEETLVVEGLITDQPGIYTVKISKSQPLWRRIYPRPLKGCIVSVSDDLGHTFNLKETSFSGVYVTDAATFRGTPGREYTLHIRTTTESVNLSYESQPVKMIPVPPVDNIYYEIKTFMQSGMPVQGCNVYLNAHDPSKKCKFFRWEFSETWEFHLPFNFPNNICWKSTNSEVILIKNASMIAESRITGQPVISIVNPTDKLSVKYSILVNQFSLNEDEYNYWERLKSTTDQTGGLYDIIPGTIPNNIYCLEEPEKKVLGYFGVSAVSSKRFFIKEQLTFSDLYGRCLADTFYTSRPDTVPDIWIITDNSDKLIPYVIYTRDRSCVDCTTRGTNIKPDFWDDDKQ